MYFKRSKFSIIFRSSIAKNLAFLVGGSGIAQLVGILASPVLSRLYTPEQFGVLGSILAVTGILSLVGSLKYEMAIVLENDEDNVEALQLLCHLVLIAITILSGIGILTAPFWLHSFKDNSELTDLLPWAVVIIFFSALYNALYSRYNREKEYREMAKVQIIKRIAHVFIQLLFGVIGASALGLLLGNVFGGIIPVIYIFYQKKSFFKYKNITFFKIKEIAKRYRMFPLYTAPQSLMNLISGQFPVFVFGAYFSMSVVGAYFFAIKLVQLPAMLIGTSVRRVFFKEVAEVITDIPTISKLYDKTTFALLVIVIVPAIILFLFGPFLFGFVFGKEWEMAGNFAKWMGLWYGSTIIGGPARSLFVSLEKQKLFFMLDSILVILRAVIIVFLSKYYNSFVAIAGFSLISVLSNILTVFGWRIYFKRILNA